MVRDTLEMTPLGYLGGRLSPDLDNTEEFCKRSKDVPLSPFDESGFGRSGGVDFKGESDVSLALGENSVNLSAPRLGETFSSSSKQGGAGGVFGVVTTGLDSLKPFSHESISCSE